MSQRQFPKLLLSLANLGGGDFGTLEISALSHRTIEFMLGGDYITLTRPQWTQVCDAVERIFGPEMEVDVAAKVVEPDGEVLEERVEVHPAPRRPNRRRAEP